MKKLLLLFRRKIVFEIWYHWLLRLSVIGMILSIVYTIASKWKYFVNANFFFGMVTVLVILLSLFITFLKRPSWKDTAQKADALGYEERFVTAIELLEKGASLTKIEELAIEDALYQGEKESIAKKYRLSFPKKTIGQFIVLCVILMGTQFFDTQNQKEAKQYAEAQLKKIEKVKQEFKQTEKLDRNMTDAFQKQIDTVTKQLKKAQTVQQSQKAIEEVQQAVKELEKDSIAKDLKKTAEGFAESEKTKELASALDQGDSNAVKSNMDTLLSQMENMSETELKDLSKELENIENLEDKELEKHINELSQQLSVGNLAQAMTEGELLKQKLNALASQNEILRENIDNLNKALAQNSFENTITDSDTPGQSGTQQQGMGQGNGQGEGGNQQGQNAGGQGQGEKPGQGRGEGHKESEMIYTRKAQEKMGYETQLQGQQLQNGESTIVSQRTMGEKGESIPYQQVYNAYRNEALQDIENSSVPYGMRELVSEYFSTLEQ